MSTLKKAFDQKKYRLISDLWEELQTETDEFDWDNYLKFYGDHLSESLDSQNKLVFTNFLSWSRSVGHFYAIPPLREDTLTKNLAGHSRRHFSEPDHRAFKAFLEDCRSNAAFPETETTSFLHKDIPLYSLATDYFSALINGDEKTAGDLIMNAIESGHSPKEIYLHVFQPGLWEIGRLWQQNKISVGQEHFFSAATQMIISRLYPIIFNSHRNEKRVVATAVGGELHEIGIRMVADFFEMYGWDTYYLGANCPNKEVIEELKRHSADVLAISITMASHLGTARNLIRLIRNSPELANTKILVGGRTYKQHGELFADLGADAWAEDAENAVLKAQELLQTG